MGASDAEESAAAEEPAADARDELTDCPDAASGSSSTMGPAISARLRISGRR
jgi:hypothetical protein